MPDDPVARVRHALLQAGHPDTITAYPEGTRTAADAAAAIGCTVAQIAKSIVFRAGGHRAPRPPSSSPPAPTAWTRPAPRRRWA